VQDELLPPAEPPDGARRMHPRQAGGVHVDARVAEEDEPVRRDAERGGDLDRRGGVGLERHARAGAGHKIEAPFPQRGGDVFARAVVGLVREDRETAAAGAQRVEEAGHPGIRFRLRVPPGRVLPPHPLHAARDRLRVAVAGRHGAEDEMLEPVPHEAPVRIRRVAGESRAAEDGVHRIRDVLDGIQERPVEVEEDGAETAHRPSSARGVWR